MKKIDLPAGKFGSPKWQLVKNLPRFKERVCYKKRYQSIIIGKPIKSKLFSIKKIITKCSIKICKYTGTLLYV